MKRIGVRQIPIRILLLFTFIFLPSPAIAQEGVRVSIDYLSDTQFPLIKAYISISDAQGLPVQNLSAGNFAVSEDNQPVADFTVTEVQNTEQPLAIVLAIDTSGSMGRGTPQTALQKSVQAAKTFINSLAPQDYVAIVSFSNTPNVAQDFTTDHALLNAALDSLKAEKDTAMYDAIAKAATMLANRGERRIIILLTDGADSGIGMSIDEAVGEAQKVGAPIYPIGFGDVDQVKLQNLALRTGGFVQVKPDTSALENAFSTVLQILRQQYLLEFYSSLPADDAKHELAVTVDFQGWHEELTHSFIGRSGQVTVTLPGYEENQIIGGNVKFAPEWTAPAPGIAQMDFIMDGNPLTSSVTAAPFEYTWTSTGTNPGSHVFTFVVTDTAGNKGQLELNLMVQEPIKIQITQPTDGATVSGKTLITTNLEALGTVERVDFLVNDQVIGYVTSSPYEWDWDSRDLPSGRYEITVNAYDKENFSSSDKATVDVTNIVLPPWVVILAALALLAVLIPLALRKRKQLSGGKAVAPAGKTGAVLHELEGVNPGQVWPLGTQEIRLGRKKDENDIPLKGLKASRKHAVIRMQNDQYLIFGLSAENPVLVNNEPVQQQILKPGDLIRLGETVLKFE